HSTAWQAPGISFGPPVPDHQALTAQSAFIDVADAALSALFPYTTLFRSTEGAPLSGVLLFHFSDADPAGAVGDYSATVTWGDGQSNSSGRRSNTQWAQAHAGGGFDVYGSHTYAEEYTGITFPLSVPHHPA